MRALCILFLFFAAITVKAEWQVLDATDESSAGALVIHRHVTLAESTTDQRAVVDLAIFSPRKCTLRLIENEDGASILAEMMGREKCLAGVNGGYFDPEFKPIGLRISGGKTIAPFQRARLLTGVLLAASRQIEILRSREFSREVKPLAAIQAGPFLVDGGMRVRGLDDSRTARRTFAVTANDQKAALGVCSEVSLAELAAILATARLGSGLKIQRALNLDGGSSTAFWFARENDRDFSIPEQKPVRDFVGIVPK